MIRFQLFRLKIYFSEEESYRESHPNRSLILQQIIKTKPSAELRAGYTWRIGNVKELDKDGLYFAFGITIKQPLDSWDDEFGDFKDDEFTSAPHTHVLLDSRLQLCAIAAQSRLSANPEETAVSLQRLLHQSLSKQQSSAQLEIASLKDSQDFIEWLKDAHAVRRFSVKVARPNLFDVHEDFQKPFERLLEEAKGESGRLMIKGPNLDLKVLEEILKSAAASGMDVDATVARQQGGPAMRRSMKDRRVTYQRRQIRTNSDKAEALAEARQIYSKIRGIESDGGDTQ